MKLSIIEFVFRIIPEGFLFVYATYVFAKKSIKMRPFVLSSILLSIAIYIIRILPIHVGVNNILNSIVFITLSVKINSFDLIKSIKVVFLATFIGFICEGINVLLIQYVFMLDINHIFSEPKLKLLYGMPSLIIISIIVSIVSYYNKIKLKNKNLKTTSA